MNRDEGGFTLPELIICIVIMALVVPVLAAAVIVGLRTTDVTTGRLAASHDADLASAWFVTDVQSTQTVSVVSAGCLPPAGSTPIVALTGTDGTTTNVAGYATVIATDRVLVRYGCVNGVPTAQATIAHRLASPPVLVCAPTPDCMASPPRSMTMTLADVTGFTFSLFAERRTS